MQKVARVLPPPAVRMLCDAAAVPLVGGDDPKRKRRAAVTKAIDLVKKTYPEYFRS